MNQRTLISVLLASLLGASAATAQDQHTQQAFEWRGAVAPGETVWLRNVNGSIRAERASGTQIEVTVEKRWRDGNPDAVEVVAVEGGGGLTICALWDAEDHECGEGGQYRHEGMDRDGSKVSMHFTVSLPDGLELDASTVNGTVRIVDVGGAIRALSTNGDVAVSSTAGPVDARTINGDVEVDASTGEVEARTTNGDLKVTLNTAPEGSLSFRTTNGSITLVVPDGLNAEVDASVANGHIDSDLPITMRGRNDRRRLRGTIGEGGSMIQLRTTNGSIRLQEQTP